MSSRWRFETAGSRDYFYGAPLLAGNRVIVNDIYASPLIAIDTRTHSELWRADAGGAPRVVIVGANVIAAGTDTKVRAIDLEIGAIRWTADSRSSSVGAGICRTSIFVSAFYLLRFDAVTGAITGQADRNAFDDFFSNVASDGARAYAVAGRGTFAFDCRH